jgi:hypothetical protein
MESLALWVIAFAVIIIATEGLRLMADFTRLNAALQSLADSVEGIAAAIRNPQTDNNDQNQIDHAAGTLEAAAETLRGLVVEENTEDGASADDSSDTPIDPGVSADDTAGQGDSVEAVEEDAPPEDAGNVGGPDEASESIAEDGPSFTTTSGNTPEQVAENEAGSEAVDNDGEPQPD